MKTFSKIMMMVLLFSIPLFLYAGGKSMTKRGTSLTSAAGIVRGPDTWATIDSVDLGTSWTTSTNPLISDINGTGLLIFQRDANTDTVSVDWELLYCPPGETSYMTFESGMMTFQGTAIEFDWGFQLPKGDYKLKVKTVSGSVVGFKAKLMISG